MEFSPSSDPCRFYVYGHFTNDGRLFYIGKGSASRAWSKAGRSDAWGEIASSNGMNVRILYKNLLEDEAIYLEEILIIETTKLTNNILCNKHKKLRTSIIPYDTLIKKVKYCENSKTGLVYVSSGKDAGWVTNRYSHIQIGDKTVLAHRAILALFDKNFDWNSQVDHIDGNGHNNKIENLRIVSAKLNVKNRVRATLTGHQLIHYRESRNSSVYFLKFDLLGKRVQVNFPVKTTKAAALEAAVKYKLHIRDILLACGYTERIYDIKQF